MTEEKTYIFHSSLINEDISVKESELTEQHKDLLLGQLINTFNYAPAEVQVNFLNRVLKKADEPKIIKP